MRVGRSNSSLVKIGFSHNRSSDDYHTPQRVRTLCERLLPPPPSGDWPAARNALRLLTGSSLSAEYANSMAASAVFGFFATPLIGTPDSIVEEMALMVDDGFDGLALSWVDYDEGLDQYQAELLPRLIARGLRRPSAP